MNDRLQKLYGKTARLRQAEIREKQMFYLLLAAFVVLLVPLLVIARYNVPAADDYWHSSVRLAWLETHSLLAFLKSAVEETISDYYTWQGNFIAVFFASIRPSVINESLHPVTSCIFLLTLCLGVTRLCILLFHDIFGGTKYQAGIIAIVVLAACTQMLPSPVQGLYWFSGVFMYTFCFSLSLLLYTGATRYLLTEPKRIPLFRRSLRLAGMSLISILVGGSNYVSALLTAIFFGCVMLVMLFSKKHRRPALLIPCVFFFIAFAINILAPGNTFRQSVYASEHPNALLAILLSLRFAFSSAVAWLKLPLLCLLVLLVPVLYHIAGKTTFSFRLPLLVLAASFCLFAAEFCPTAYAGGGAGPVRLQDIVYFFFVLLAAFDLFYLLGWLRRSLSKWSDGDIPLSEHLHGRLRYSFLFLGAVAVIFALGSLYPRSATYTSTSALRSLVTGEAAAYYETHQEQLALLTDESMKDVALPPYLDKPYVIYLDDGLSDISPDDPDDPRNMVLAEFYGKDSVVLAAPDTVE